MDWITTLAAREGALFWTGIVAVVFTGVVLSNLRQMYQIRERNRTIRQIARHVADGELTPDQGATLIGPLSEDGRSDAEKEIATGVAWGTVAPEKAERLLQALRRPSEQPTDPRKSLP